MDGLKDSRLTIWFMGYLVPLTLLVFGVLNITEHTAYLPVDRRTVGDSLWGLAKVYTDPWRVYGEASFNIGMAIGLHGWFRLANEADLEHLAHPLVAVGIVLVLGGFLAFAAAFF